MKKKRQLGGLFGATLGAIALTIVSQAWAWHPWGNYHWQRAENPVALVLGDNLTRNYWQDDLFESSQDWDHLASSFGYADVLSLSIAAGSPANPRRCSPKTGNIEICNGNYGFNGWLGIASIYIDGDHIQAASVKLNDSYHDLEPYNSDTWRKFVMCQEVGHVFGLGHQDENFDNANLGSCMDYTSDPSTNLQPNAHDFQQLAAIYAHADGGDPPGDDGSSGGKCRGGPKKCPGKAAGASAARHDIELSEPRQWGELVSTHGPQEVFMLDLGDGRRVITHVLWTLERARSGHDDH